MVEEDLAQGIGEYRASNTGERLKQRVSDKLDVEQAWRMPKRGDVLRYRALYTHIRALILMHETDH